MLVLISTIFVMTAQLLGWLAGIDSMARAWYMKAADTRGSAQKVLVVGAGPLTAFEWRHEEKGLNRLESVLSTIAAGHPNLMVLVEPESVFGIEASTIAAIVAESRWQGKIVLARASIPAMHSGGFVEAVAAQDPEQSAFTRPSIYPAIARLTALSQVHGEDVHIHYLNPPSRLPNLPMHAVAAGSVSNRAFEGKIVLIGPTGAPWAESVETLVGQMSPLEVHAHALAGLIDGVVWRELSPINQGFALASCLLLVSLWLRNRPSPSSLRGSLLATVLVLLADYILYTRGLIRWGASAPVLGIWTLQLIYLRESFVDLTGRLGSMQTRLSELLPLAAAARDGTQDIADAAFWQDLADLGRTYVRADVVTMIAELPANNWHLQFRASSGIALQDIEEKRRDIRRAPFRGPFLTHRAGWANGFLRDAEGEKTLLVPIQHESRLFGFWLVHTTPETKIDDGFVTTSEALGRQMAQLIHTRRYGPGKTAAPAGAANAGQEAIAEMDRTVSEVESSRRWAVEILEQDEQGVLLASLWGPLEMVNRPMRDLLRAHFPGGVPGEDIRAILAKLTGGSMEQVQTMMRAAIVDHETIVLSKPLRETAEIHADLTYTLRRIDLDAEKAVQDDASGEKEVFPDMERARLILHARRDVATKVRPTASVLRAER
jgi:hypothetical protein